MKYIGKRLKKRMKLMDVSVDMLSEDSFVDKDLIKNILKNKVSLNDIDEFDLALICSALHCDIAYFTEGKDDFLSLSVNRGLSMKPVKVMAKIQDFMNDRDFINSLSA